MFSLAILWFILIFLLVAVYFILDGFDLGVGVLYPFIAKDEREKHTLIRAIGPVWDGNEVWLLTAGGALFAAFAPAYATSFSGFYLAIMLVLFGLILRAVSLEFRAHETTCLKLWDSLFFIGSLLPALLFGVAIGNILIGLPLNANGDYTGSFFALLNPFALLCGVLGLVYMVFQGAAWIALKSPEESELRQRASQLRTRAGIAAAALFALASVLFLVMVKPGITYNLGGLAPLAVIAVLVVACALFAALGTKRCSKADRNSFLAASVGAALLVTLVGTSLFPTLIPATDPALSITIANAAASNATLLPMTIIAAIGVPLVLLYHVFAYRVFRGRIE